MKIEIFGAVWCGPCKQLKQLCESKSMQYQYYDIDNEDDLDILEERLGTKVRSIPQVFLDGQLITSSELKKELEKTVVLSEDHDYNERK